MKISKCLTKQYGKTHTIGMWVEIPKKSKYTQNYKRILWLWLYFWLLGIYFE